MLINELVSGLGGFASNPEKAVGELASKAVAGAASFADTLKGVMPGADGITADADPGKRFIPLAEQNMQGISINSGNGQSFAGTMNEFMSDVNNLQKDAYDLTDRMIKGEPVDIHDVMIASEKAKTSFQLLLEMRNKFLDMYREVLRIQM